jgi:hypothetical protein
MRTADRAVDPEGVDLAYPGGFERTRPDIDGSTVEDRP